MGGGLLRILPWGVALVCLVAFGLSFAELQRVRGKLGEATRHVFHDHRDVRQFIINAALAETSQPIVILGDSITEMAPLPQELLGHPLINAGVGGLTIIEATSMAQRLFAGRQPFMIICTIGANDVGSQSLEQDYATLLRTLVRITPRMIAISGITDDAANAKMRASAASGNVTFKDVPLPPDGKMSDGIHLTTAGYRVWVAALTSEIATAMALEAPR